MIVVYPGSFDPFTLGHYNLVYRALLMGIDKVIIAVMSNPKKQTSRTVEQRIEIIERSINNLSGVEIVNGSGKMVVDIVRSNRASAILKGLRGIEDYENEKIQSKINYAYLGAVDTIFLNSLDPEISSSAVRELVKYGARDEWEFMVCGSAGRLVEKYYGV